MDNDLRGILKCYHIDDSEIVQIDEGPVHRLVVVHPERPLPTYIEQDKGLVQQLKGLNQIHFLKQKLSFPLLDSMDSFSLSSPSNQPNEKDMALSEQNTDASVSVEQKKPKITLEERVARGEAHIGPTIPLRQVQEGDDEPSPSIHQVYPPLNEAEQEEQKKQAKLQATQPMELSQSLESVSTNKEDREEKASRAEKLEELTLSNASASQQNQAQKKQDLTSQEEEKIVQTVVNQLTPVVEQLVLTEVRRALCDQSDHDFMPFPFMFANNAPIFASRCAGPIPNDFQQGQTTNRARVRNL